LKTHKPKKVVLVCGENDLANGLTPRASFLNFKKIVERVTEAGANVLYMGTKPEPETKSLHRICDKYDALVREYAWGLATESAVTLPPLRIVDVSTGFLALVNKRNLYKADGLRLSKLGYSHWTKWAKHALRLSTGCVEFLSGKCSSAEVATSQAPTPASSSSEYRLIVSGKIGMRAPLSVDSSDQV